jgi:pimeloyl-ACP methyl ester carboxylesterase
MLMKVGIKTIDDKSTFVVTCEGFYHLPELRRFNLPLDNLADETELQAVIDTADWYDDVRGYYRLDDGSRLVIGRKFDGGTPLYFIERNFSLNRIYPVGDHEFLGEMGETLRVEGERITLGDRVGIREDFYRTERVVVDTGDYQLGGSLLVPFGIQQPFPVIIMVHGSDTHDRDFYEWRAQPYLEAGCAAFVYDKRGWFESTGEALSSQILELTDDVVRVYNHLRDRDDVGAVGLYGFSNGGWTAPLAATRVEDPAFLVVLSGAGYSAARQEQIRRTNVVKELGANEEGAAFVSRFWESAYHFGGDGKWTPELEAMIVEMNEHKQLQALPKTDHAPSLQPVPPILPLDYWRSLGGQLQGMSIDPLPLVEQLDCPVLYMWGERDTLQDVSESYDRMRVLDHVRLEIIPEVSHQFFEPVPPPDGIRYSKMEWLLHHMTASRAAHDLQKSWIENILS